MVKIMMHGCNGVMGQVISKIVEEPVESVMEIETTYGNIFEVLYIHREQAMWYQTGIRYLEKLPY